MVCHFGPGFVGELFVWDLAAIRIPPKLGERDACLRLSSNVEYCCADSLFPLKSSFHNPFIIDLLSKH